MDETMGLRPSAQDKKQKAVRNMLETILQYLQWAIPGGLGACVAWLLSRKIRSAREAKEVHDTYREMYGDVSRELQEMRKENERLYKAITRLERTVSRATACRYWAQCPVRSELPDTKERGTNNNTGRHPQSGPHRIRDTDDHNGGNSERLGERDDTNQCDTEPP